ncbi:MAG: sigma 54-interacting transcriptional regulator, partial [Aquificaceae bacterium]
TGVGKDLIARLIHLNSSRKDSPFVVINCPSIPWDLFEIELFGCVKGAFTGAIADKKGKAELAEGGTLFFNEIGDLPYKLQAKLLDFIERKSFYPVGGSKEVKVDVRLIFATNKNLRELTREDKFREDLYHRISTFLINIPPLRERGEDILLLAEHFLSLYLKKYGKGEKYLSQEAKRLLLSYPWKGNVRELKNLMERLALLHEGAQITEKDLRHLTGFQHTAEDINRLLFEKDLKRAKQEFERIFIERKLREYNYDLKRTAEAIGIDLSNLYRKIRQYEIEVESP